MFKRISMVLVATALTLGAPDAHAQIVNVLPLSASDEDGFSAMMEVGLEYRSGNINLLEAEGEGAVVYRHRPHMVLLSVFGEYGVEDEERFAAHIFEHLRYRYRMVGDLELEGLAQHEFDQFRRLENRMLVGTGLRYLLARWDHDTVFGGTTFLVEHEDLDDVEVDGAVPADAHDSYTRLRSSNYLNFNFHLTDILRFEQSFFYQVLYNDADDYRLLSDTGLVVQITQYASIVNSLGVHYDHRPPIGVENADITLETAVAFEF